MTTRKFYRTVIQVEVLSEEPIPDTLSLEEICRESVEGEYSFEYTRCREQEMDGKEMANALIEQGSEPSFFRLTDDGNDTEI